MSSEKALGTLPEMSDRQLLGLGLVLARKEAVLRRAGRTEPASEVAEQVDSVWDEVQGRANVEGVG